MRGFLLQATQRIESGRPVVWIHAKAESGGSMLVRETRQRPCFFIRRDDALRAERLGARIADDGRERRALDDGPVVRVGLDHPADAPLALDRLHEADIPTYEADVRLALRYLIEHGIRGGFEVEGPSRRGPGVDAVFDDPVIRPADWTPRLDVLSLDIETDPSGRRLLSVALAGATTSEVLLLTADGVSCPSDAVPCRDERELLRRLERRIAEIDPDVLTGWNVVDFDLAVLERVARRVGVGLALGRGPEPLRVRAGGGRAPTAFLPGRLVLDGIALLRGAFVRLESYALDHVAHHVLGDRKTIRGPDRATEILRAFENDRPRFVEYNRHDAQLVLRIVERLRLVELAVERSRLTGMPADRVAASIACFDFLYLSELTRRAIVAPTLRSAPDAAFATTGGHVLEPRPGLYRNVLVFDFRSLYPSVIRTFQIDPLGLLAHPTVEDDPIVAPSGAAFRRQPGILPRILDELFPRREAARAAGDAVAAQAIKILMNSFYGVLGTPACRFASPHLANAITAFGREILLWTRERVESAGLAVLYGDTDSLFVNSNEESGERAQTLGAELAARLNADLARYVAQRWRVTSRLELVFERCYARFLLPLARGRAAGARKRYAGRIDAPEGPRIVFTGLEAVRSDWTPFARAVQRELYARLFTDRPVEEYLRGVIDDLRAGRLDDQLIYRRALRKQLSAYTATTPPHVAAARRMRRRPGRVVAYVMTQAGAEPADARTAPIDHEHYVERQLRPVAEPVLELLGLDFARIAGGETQLRLF